MSSRLYPRTRAEHAAAAQHLFAQMTDPEADPDFVAKANQLTGTSCPAYLSALETHRQTRARTTMALDAQDQADIDRDKAGSDFIKAVRLNCEPEVYLTLKSMLSGRAPSEVFGSAIPEQHFIEEVFFSQLDARTDVKVPTDRLNTWREKHEQVRLCMGEVSAAQNQQRDASAAVDSTEAAFSADYSLLIKHLVLLWSEEKTRATLLGFATRVRKASPAE